jgi:type I restriction enzyme S subunit
MHSAWATAKLRTIASVVTSNVDKHLHEDEIPVRLCNYLDVYRNRRLSKPYQFSEGSVTKAELDRFSIRRGDVLITKDSETPDDIGVPCLIADDFENTVCGYHLALIRAGDRLNPSFLSYLFQSEAARRYFLAQAAGLTRFGLNARTVGGLLVPTPPLDEQDAIANVLDAV